jgi:hypothetical protein
MYKLESEDIEFIIRSYQLDDKLLNEAIQQTKEILQYIYSTICSKHYDTKIPFFKTQIVENRAFCISGNSIATLIRNFYLNPQKAKSKYGTDIDSFDMHVRDIEYEYESDIDVYFHKYTGNGNLYQLGYVLRNALSEIKDDRFIQNVKIADKDSTCIYGTNDVMIKEGESLITDNAVTMADGTQFILCAFGENFTDSFDFEHCKMKYDGTKLYASRLQLICAIYKLMLYNTSKTKTYRIEKYKARGFNCLNLRLDMNVVKNAFNQ